MAAPAGAQDWATREACDLSDARIHPDALAPATLDDLRQSARAIPNGLGRYWRITSPDGAVSHLWGTMHLNDPVILALPGQVQRDITNSRVVAVEANFIAPSRTDFQHYMRSDHIWRRDGSKGFENLDIPKKVKGWIRARFEGLGWDAETPEILELATIEEFTMSDPCSDFAYGVYPSQDNHIQLLGALSGADILGLEGARAIYEKLAEESNFKLNEAMIALNGSYLDPTLSHERYTTNAALYLQGKIGTMMMWEEVDTAEVLGAEKGREWLRRVDDYMLIERNQHFLERAIDELAEGGVFMAVGSFHLPRETGMVALLRDADFAVERIVLPDEARL